jgi:hypothetical protein
MRNYREIYRSASRQYVKRMKDLYYTDGENYLALPEWGKFYPRYIRCFSRARTDIVPKGHRFTHVSVNRGDVDFVTLYGSGLRGVLHGYSSSKPECPEPAE